MNRVICKGCEYYNASKNGFMLLRERKYVPKDHNIMDCLVCTSYYLAFCHILYSLAKA